MHGASSCCSMPLPSPPCSVFEVWERGATRTAKGCELPLHRGSELLPQVVEAVVQGVRELPCGLTVQLLWLPLVQGGEEECAGAGGGGDGARSSTGVGGGLEAVCMVPALHVTL